MPLLLKFILALLPVPLFYLQYRRYFEFRPNLLEHLRFFLVGIIIAALSGIVAPLLSFLPENALAIAFLRAALLEKIGPLLVLYAIVRRLPDFTTVNETLALGMLLGIGFSCLENIMYASASQRDTLLILRIFTSVPLHAATIGLMGYDLGLMRLVESKWRSRFHLSRALILPWILHGLFDSGILGGRAWTILSAFVLAALLYYLEILFARSRTLPVLAWLNALDLRYEDWQSIERDPAYERWILKSMGSRQQEESFFRKNPGQRRIVALGLAIAFSLAYPYLSELSVFQGLPRYEILMILVFLPLILGANFFLTGLINPAYFRSGILRIPVIADVELSGNKALLRSITYDISAASVFIKTIEPLQIDATYTAYFDCNGIKSPGTPALVVWDNHAEDGQPAGTVLRLEPAPGTFLFLLRYQLFKATRSFMFNLKLPGFEGLRRLFVRPASVMQRNRRYKAGTILFQEGDAGQHFYLIRSGTVTIYKTTPDGAELEMATLGESSIFGELALVGDQPRAACARCETDVTLSIASADNLEAMIRSNPDFASRLIHQLARQWHRSEETLEARIRQLKRDLDKQTMREAMQARMDAEI